MKKNNKKSRFQYWFDIFFWIFVFFNLVLITWLGLGSSAFITTTLENYKVLYAINVAVQVIFVFVCIIWLYIRLSDKSKTLWEKIRFCILYLLFQIPFMLVIIEFPVIEKGVAIMEVRNFKVVSAESFRIRRSNYTHYDKYILANGRKFYVSNLLDDFDSPDCPLHNYDARSSWEIVCNVPLRLYYLDSPRGLIKVEKM